MPGFEFLAGIPGTVGAAVRLNAGAEGQSLAGVLKRVWVATPQLQLLELTPAELGLGYRTSLLLNFPHWLVVEAEFNLAHPAAPEAVRARMAALIARRKTRQPANPKSCGSVFKNPVGGPAAGWLIEAAGFKGHRLGDAVVSRKHANFILNAWARHRGPGQGPDGRYSGKGLADPGGGPGAGSGLAAGGFGISAQGRTHRSAPTRGLARNWSGGVRLLSEKGFGWHRLNNLCGPSGGHGGPPQLTIFI